MALTPQHTVEEALRTVEDRAAMLRFFADSIRQVEVVPEQAFFSGLADSLEEIQSLVHAVRRVRDVDALGTEIGSDQKRRRGPKERS